MAQQSVTITVSQMFVVTIEYGSRRKPQVIGPFFDYNTATHWMQSQPDFIECKRLGYYRPHGKPQEFVRMSIQAIKSYHV